MSAENATQIATLIEIARFLRHSCNLFYDKGYGKRFMILGRQAMKDDFFQVREIVAAGFKDWRGWIHDYFFGDDIHHVHSINTFYSETIVREFALRVYNFILEEANHELIPNESDNQIWIQLAADWQFKTTMNEAGQETQNDAQETTNDQKQEEASTEASEAQETTKKRRKTEPTPAPVVEIILDTKTESDEFNLPIGRMIERAVNKFIEATPLIRDLEKRFNEEVAKVKPIQINIAGRPSIVLQGKQHKNFPDALKLATLEKQVFLAGPMGTGKTTLSKQIATAFNLPFGHISCTIGLAEAQLLGRQDAHGVYTPAKFVTLFENGGVFLFDEMDAADANTMLVINSALANGYLSVPNRKENPTAERHPDFICVCAANTWGFGSNEYAGRNILDAAFLDRFVGSRIFVDYDRELEAEISSRCPEVAEFIWAVRDNCKEARIRRAVSTRALEAGVRRVLCGDDLVDFAKQFFIGWTEEERKKAMKDVKLPERKSTKRAMEITKVGQ